MRRGGMGVAAVTCWFVLLGAGTVVAGAGGEKEQLKTLTEKIEQEKAKQENLREKAKVLEADVKDLKKDLVAATGKVQTQQEKLENLKTALGSLDRQKKKSLDKLGADRESLSALIVALGRIRRLPPETLMARPGAPLETATAATALAAVLPEVNKRAEALKVELGELEKLEHSFRKNQEELERVTESFKADQSRMNTLLKEREKAYGKTRREEQAQAATIAAISKQAQDIRDLIEQIEKQKRKKEKAKKSERARERERERAESSGDRGDEAALTGSLPALGDARLPVSGNIITRYGEKDDIGATSQGVRVASPSGAVVVAPMEGVVRYAGPFKAYGSIVLLEHKNGYHSLVAGLGKIDTFVGQNLDSGEPLGRMPVSAEGGRVRLYYELRFKGQPINPARKLSGLAG